ncbi:hypothetical protein [Methanoculleus chikugoensis]|uniref:hypothetical protein n=1 Tax=Methanoculleus chikugoensis TaxID=118126 RepID=UPI001FB23843|nr:hypothetical protein [Methanoculleus chikugoensis]
MGGLPIVHVLRPGAPTAPTSTLPWTYCSSARRFSTDAEGRGGLHSKVTPFVRQ